MTDQLPEALRQLFLSEQGIETNPNDLEITETEAQAFQNAKTLFLHEVHPLFTTVWGEIWISNSQIEEGLMSKACQLWVIALHGLDADHIASAVNAFVKENKGKYPPNPLQFREYCRAVQSEHALKKNHDKAYEILN
ncbi:hypothetical protein [Photobacterium galatheae]|uniref:Uncharacterized protein n=1 Tax=Photobacterium galatheae TaxID=1654360 RepID=A0A066RRE7_9GAMM|nr:hypothetical protein [Photobacterium galatheae]KDM89978.1 hypothetical protein EA58_19735 [Photobacterium galatheae]MCM0149228.1 hypothetical protein [Photobacterium galatheae]